MFSDYHQQRNSVDQTLEALKLSLSTAAGAAQAHEPTSVLLEVGLAQEQAFRARTMQACLVLSALLTAMMMKAHLPL